MDNGADVIVITSGGGYDHNGLHEAIQTANEKGVMVVVAAGNRANDEPFYPGSYDESFTVAGTSTDDAPYDHSTYGTQIDISAPATHIYSTYISHDGGEPGYTYMTGTSMAAPHVAGLAALILSIDPDLPVADLEAVITQTADDIGEPGKDIHFGYGRINAWRAVWAVSPAVGNLRPGHARIPTLGDLNTETITTESIDAGIELQWQLADAGENNTIAVYRSPVPQMDSAIDVVEVPAVSTDGQLTGRFVDTDVTVGTTYYYWLVLTDRSVETASSDMLTVVAEAPEPVVVEPETPQPEEQQPEIPNPEVVQPAGGTSLLLPLLQVNGS